MRTNTATQKCTVFSEGCKAPQGTPERERSERTFRALLQETLTARALEQFDRNGRMKELIARVANRTLDPYTAVEEVLGNLGL